MSNPTSTPGLPEMEIFTQHKNYGPRFPDRNRIRRGALYKANGKLRYMTAGNIIANLVRPQMIDQSPEAELFLAVIRQSIDDYACPDQYTTDADVSEARQFLFGDGLGNISTLIGIEPEVIRDALIHVMGGEEQIYDKGMFD